MKERVSTLIGQKSIIIVAPHGADDINTDIVAEHIAKLLDAYAVINRGFERSDIVDVNNDKANCNRIDHCKSEVVFDEFFKPILKFKDRLGNKLVFTGKYPTFKNILIFYIHGCGNIVHKKAKEQVGVILGYGLGTKKDSLTCDMWIKNLFVDTYRYNSKSGEVFEARGGSNYAGRDSNNLNQYFRKHDLDVRVNSIQLEIPYSCRNTENEALNTGKLLAKVILSCHNHSSYDKEPTPKFI